MAERRRPATARRPRRAGPPRSARPRPAGSDDASGRRRRTPLTTRAALLGVTVSAVAVLLALPLKTYLGQHGKIGQIERDQATQQRRIQTLQQAVQRYGDPAYVAQQARERLQYVLPGEQDYVVVAPPSTTPKAAAHPPGRPAVDVPRTSARAPWWSRLWAGASQAGRP